MSEKQILSLESIDEAKAWMLAFEAHCRGKGLEDKLSASGSSPITDKFLERCGSKVLLKLVSLMRGKDIEKCLYADLKTEVLNYVAPKTRLLIADRTNFLQLSQNLSESEKDFLARLNEAASYCKWDDLKTGKIEPELIRLRFIAGLSSDVLKLKVLEKIQINPKCTVDDLVDFCQMTVQLKTFVEKKDTSNTENSSDNFYVSRNRSEKCHACAKFHPPGHCSNSNIICHKCVQKRSLRESVLFK